MSSVKVECVVKGNCLIGEGPVWEEQDQTLLFVDIGGEKIHRWNSLTNHIQSVDTGRPIRRQLGVPPWPMRSPDVCVCAPR